MCVCPHCGGAFADKGIDKHMRACLGNPVIATYVKAGLHEASPLGVLVSYRDYNLLLKRESFADMPSACFLVLSCGGSWDGVASWAGLLPHRAYTNVVYDHARRFIGELSARLHMGGTGCSAREYDVFREDYLPPAEELVRRRGSWAAVLAWAGDLSEASELYYEKQARLRMQQLVVERNERAAARRRLQAIESRLEERERLGAGLPALESRVVVAYDPNRHMYYEQTVTSLR